MHVLNPQRSSAAGLILDACLILIVLKFTKLSLNTESRWHTPHLTVAKHNDTQNTKLKAAALDLCGPV